MTVIKTNYIVSGNPELEDHELSTILHNALGMTFERFIEVTLSEVRERIALIPFPRTNVKRSTIPLVGDWVTLPDSAIDQILSDPDLKMVLDKLDQTRDDCPKCRGSRRKFIRNDFESHTIDCPTCNGTGKDGWHPERLLVKAEDQSKPLIESYFYSPLKPDEALQHRSFQRGQDNMRTRMLTPDAQGRVWAKVEEKKEG